MFTSDRMFFFIALFLTCFYIQQICSYKNHLINKLLPIQGRRKEGKEKQTVSPSGLPRSEVINLPVLDGFYLSFFQTRYMQSLLLLKLKNFFYLFLYRNEK